MRVFVTVGATTSFDLLVEAILSDRVRKTLLDKGYDQLVIQVGPSERYHDLQEERDGLTIQLWKFKPSLKKDLEASDLVISHAGAFRVHSFLKKFGVDSHTGSGSILDALRLYKPLIVVPNPTLLHNHQTELAEALEQRGYISSSRVSYVLLFVVWCQKYQYFDDSNLASTISGFDPGKVLQFPEFDGTGFRSLLDEEMGYNPYE